MHYEMLFHGRQFLIFHTKYFFPCIRYVVSIKNCLMEMVTNNFFSYEILGDISTSDHLFIKCFLRQVKDFMV